MTKVWLDVIEVDTYGVWDCQVRTQDNVKWDSISIDQLDLSVRTRKGLWKCGAKTVGDVTRLSNWELLSLHNFGETSLEELQGVLAIRNLFLKGEGPK